AGLCSQALDVGGIAEVGRHEPGAPTAGADRLDGLSAACLVTAVDDDLGAVAGQLQGDRAAEAGRRARHEGLLVLEVAMLDRGHGFSPGLAQVDRQVCSSSSRIL